MSKPTLPVTDMAEATAFYERGGFGVRHYSDGGDSGGGFAFVEHDGQSVFDLDAIADLDTAANRAGCYLIANDADDWHASMQSAGLPVTPIADQPWGMREFTLTDPYGNRVRIGRGVDGGDEPRLSTLSHSGRSVRGSPHYRLAGIMWRAALNAARPGTRRDPSGRARTDR